MDEFLLSPLRAFTYIANFCNCVSFLQNNKGGKASQTIFEDTERAGVAIPSAGHGAICKNASKLCPGHLHKWPAMLSDGISWLKSHYPLSNSRVRWRALSTVAISSCHTEVHREIPEPENSVERQELCKTLLPAHSPPDWPGALSAKAGGAFPAD